MFCLPLVRGISWFCRNEKKYAGGGLFTLLVSVVGLCATSRRSPCLLVFYALCLCLAFLVLVAGNFCQRDLCNQQMTIFVFRQEWHVPFVSYSSSTWGSSRTGSTTPSRGPSSGTTARPVWPPTPGTPCKVSSEFCHLG